MLAHDFLADTYMTAKTWANHDKYVEAIHDSGLGRLSLEQVKESKWSVCGPHGLDYKLVLQKRDLIDQIEVLQKKLGPCK